jgi:glutamine amidotransferase
MCRLFGFRSIFSSQIHSSLIGADNALMNQSERHPDGWGVAYYLHNTPHLIKSPEQAIQDSLFKKVSGIVSSQTVLAHLRKATAGEVSLLNCHPFQYGQWVFAHNGNIKNFDQVKDEIQSHIDAPYSKYILGDTDSETLFYFLLSQIKPYLNTEKPLVGDLFEEMLQAISRAIEKLISIIGPICNDESKGNKENFLTFILTDGKAMIAFHGGQKVYYSTHKQRCPERDTCPFLDHSCENPIIKNQSKVNHLLISSEPLQNENVWSPFKLGQMVAVDHQLHYSTHQLSLK